MALHTLVISNRNVNQQPNRKKDKRLFGNQLTEDTNRIRVAKGLLNPLVKKRIPNRKTGKKTKLVAPSKPYKLDLCPVGGEAQLMRDMVANDNGRPWLLFLHGNNQSFAKNMTKCRAIQEMYDVNLIVFSWPSLPYKDQLTFHLLAAAVKGIKKKWWSAKNSVKDGLEQKIRQYRCASDHASMSCHDFVSALQLITPNLLEPLKQLPNPPTVSMLVHSLGHKVLKHAHMTGELNGFHFDSLVLHQADELKLDHQNWVGQLDIVAVPQEEIYVTCNQSDAALMSSDIVNNLIPDSEWPHKFNISDQTFLRALSHARKFAFKDFEQLHRTRVGNRVVLPTPPYQNLDFTEDFHALSVLLPFKKEVGFKHSIAWDKDTPDGVIHTIRDALF